jgi:fructose-bisphosphate aldolase class I
LIFNHFNVLLFHNRMEKTTTGINKFKEELIATARTIATPGKGILAADQNVTGIEGWFKKANIENTLENRRAYRELIINTPGIEQYVSAMIFYEEQFYMKTSEGVSFVKVLSDKGILVGVKADTGSVVIGGTNNETATQGLDDLGKRTAKYYQEGARFMKWRAILRIGKNEPSLLAIRENAHGLARYAAICQENGLVPIVEPDVLIEGDHTIEECAKKCEQVFSEVVKCLQDYNVLLEGILLKPNMITPGSTCEEKVTPKEIALLTIRTLLRTIPGAIPGIMFLSGGQTEEEAAENLNEINLIGTKAPWYLSFSFGRALQTTCLKVWQAKPENYKEAQNVVLEKCRNNSLASLGKYVKP